MAQHGNKRIGGPGDAPSHSKSDLGTLSLVSPKQLVEGTTMIYKRIAVADCETADFDKGGVCEVAVVVLDSQTLEETSHGSSLVDPGIPITAQASAVHHLTDADVEGAPALAEAMASILPSPEEDGGMLVVAHHAEFDRAHLSPIRDLDWLCTYRSALHEWSDAPAYGNQVLRYWLGLRVEIPEGLYPHRALYDALVTAETLRSLLSTNSLDELVSRQHLPVLLKKVGFGKHRGENWRDVPASYLQWILRDGDFDGDVVHTANHHLEGQR